MYGNCYRLLHLRFALCLCAGLLGAQVAQAGNTVWRGYNDTTTPVYFKLCLYGLDGQWHDNFNGEAHSPGASPTGGTFVYNSYYSQWRIWAREGSTPLCGQGTLLASGAYTDGCVMEGYWGGPPPAPNQYLTKCWTNASAAGGPCLIFTVYNPVLNIRAPGRMVCPGQTACITVNAGNTDAGKSNWVVVTSFPGADLTFLLDTNNTAILHPSWDPSKDLTLDKVTPSDAGWSTNSNGSVSSGFQNPGTGYGGTAGDTATQAASSAVKSSVDQAASTAHSDAQGLGTKLDQLKDAINAGLDRIGDDLEAGEPGGENPNALGYDDFAEQAGTAEGKGEAAQETMSEYGTEVQPNAGTISNPGNWEVSGMGATWNLNPFADGDISAVAAWVRGFLGWAFVLALAGFVTHETRAVIVGMGAWKQSQGSIVAAFGFATNLATGALASALILAALALIPAFALGFWQNHSVLFAVLSTNPLVSAHEGIQRGVWILDQVVPLDTVFTCASLAVAYTIGLIVLCYGKQTIVRAIPG